MFLDLQSVHKVSVVHQYDICTIACSSHAVEEFFAIQISPDMSKQTQFLNYQLLTEEKT